MLFMMCEFEDGRLPLQAATLFTLEFHEKVMHMY